MTAAPRPPRGDRVAWLALALLAASWLAGAGPARGAGVSAEARLGPRAVRLGDTVRLEIEVAGDGFDQPRLRPRFELHNLQIVGGPEQLHGFRMGTGGVGWRYSWTWQLRPQEVGEAAVTSIRVLVGDEVMELSSRRIQVLSGGLPGTDRRNRPREPPELFLRTVVEPSHPYVGQRTVYTAYLYARVDVRQMEPDTMPSFDGCWARDVDIPPDARERVRVEGTYYSRIPIYRRELYPLRAGTLDLGTLRARFLIERIERNRLFFPPVRAPGVVSEESNRIELPVRPLPEPAAGLADRFNGAVGPLSVTAHLDRAEVTSGHGATLTVQITGQGHLEALRPPRIAPLAGIDVIGPQETAPTARPGGSDDSRRAWSFVLVPRRPGSWQLPPVEVAYFDPTEGRYRLASSRLPALVATPPGHRLAGDTGAAGFHSIRSAALPDPATPRWTRLLPWAFGIPWVLALALLAARETGAGRRLTRLRWSLGGGEGRLQAVERLRAGLARAAAEERPRRAAIGLERAWRSFLAEVLGVPETVPSSGWADALAGHGIPEKIGHRLNGLLEDLHFLRYAPELSDAGSVAAELAARFERLAGELLDRVPRTA